MNKKQLLLALSASFVLTGCKQDTRVEADPSEAQDSAATSLNKESSQTLGEPSVEHWSESTVGVLSEGLNSGTKIDEYLGNGVNVLKNGVSINEVTFPNGYAFRNQPSFIAFTNKLHVFGSEIIEKLLRGSETNTCVSFFSIISVVTMLTECSGDDVRALILNKLDMTIEDMRTNMIKLIKLVSPSNSYCDYVLDVCNSIWIRNNAQYSQECVNNLASYFAATTFGFTDSAAAEAAISAYISANTNGLINPTIQIDDSVQFVIMNVLYLKDSWYLDPNWELSETETTYDFFNANGTIKTTKLLKGFYCDGRVANFPTYKQFYINTYNYVKLTFMVPNEGVRLDEIMTKENIETARNTRYITTDRELKEDYHTNCIFPEFEADYSGQILDAVKESIGIENRWYLDSLSIKENTVPVIAIDHQAKLIVDAKGIVGAAATEMYAGAGLVTNRQVYETLEVTRAFGFLVTIGDVNIFTGKVNAI